MEPRVTIKWSFQSLFNEVNDLTTTSKMNVDGQEVKTEFYLSGDYHFILLVLGLKGATKLAGNKSRKKRRKDPFT